MDGRDLLLTFSWTTAGEDEFTEAFCTRKQDTQNRPGVARSCFVVAGTKSPLGPLS
mgnify:CR=1 FL=1